MRDLLAHKTRTVLVVLSIAVGVFAVAVMMGGRSILIRSLDEGFPATLPATVTYFTSPVDDVFVSAIEREPDVEAAVGQRSVSTSYRLNGGPWNSITDPGVQGLRRHPREQAGPARCGPMAQARRAVHRGGVDQVDGAQSSATRSSWRWPETSTRASRSQDVVHDLNAPLPMMTGRAVGYVNWDTLPDLDEPQVFNQVDVRAAGRLSTIDEASALGARLRDEVIEPAGVRVLQMIAFEPGVQAIADIFKAVSMLLVLVGVLTLLLSGFLVINTIGSLVAQQTRQLGVMKAIGARRGQLAALYFVMVLAYGVMALLLAIPLGQIATRSFVDFGSGVLNFRVTDFSTPGPILAIELAVGLLVPLLAATVPVVLGMRMPVREALYSSGTKGLDFGHGLLDRLLGGVKGLSRPVALALRNTFVRKGRLALTLAALMLAASTFIAVASVRSSIDLTVRQVGEHRTMDVWADVYPPQPLEVVQRERRSRCPASSTSRAGSSGRPSGCGPTARSRRCSTWTGSRPIAATSIPRSSRGAGYGRATGTRS